MPKGSKDEMGKEASTVPADMNRDAYGAQVRARLGGREVIPPPSRYQLFTPVIDTFVNIPSPKGRGFQEPSSYCVARDHEAGLHATPLF
jgi:hypothetical protein